MDPSKAGPSNRRKKDGDLQRNPRTWEFIMAAVESLNDDEKMAVVEGKYKSILKQFQEMEVEISTLRGEQKKAEMLENLARGLQKQNKEIMEESSQRLKNEEQKRREVAANFAEKLNTLTALMDENKDKSVRLREENINMTTKFTELYEQFQERETHLANMNCQLDLQKKLSDTQQKKLEVEFQTEREIWQKERLLLVANIRRSEEANGVLQENVKSLQDHLDSYQKQYTDFETTMKRSNKVFDNFKEELARIHKSNSTMEKDRNEWHSRWQIATQTIVELTEQHGQTTKDLIIAQRKIAMLEKLCRKLQTDRVAYIQQLKEHNIEPFTIVNTDNDLPTYATACGIIKTAKSTIPSAPLNVSSPPGNTQSQVVDKEQELVELSNSESKINSQQQDDVPRKAKEMKVSCIETSESTLDTISSASFQQGDSGEPSPGLKFGDAQDNTDRVIELRQTVGRTDIHNVLIHNTAEGPSGVVAVETRERNPPNLENEAGDENSETEPTH